MIHLKRRILSLMLCGALLLSMCATGTALEPEEGVDNQPSGNAAETQAGNGNSDWTICLYMCGSDLESGGSAASIDLMEMLRAVQLKGENGTVFPDSVNLLVMTGGALAWDAEGEVAGYAKEHGLHYLKPGTDRVELFKLTPEKGMERLNSELDQWTEKNAGDWKLTNNMANPDTAKIFGSFAIDRYPAEHMMFAFWDHGGAFIGGCEVDDNNDSAALSSASVNTIIDALKERRGRKLDLVGFDACLMYGLEMAHVLSDSADYMIASEEVEPGAGWAYRWLNLFRDGGTASSRISAADIGKEIIDQYPFGFAGHDPEHIEACTGEDNIWNHAGETTLALTDLSKVDGLMGAFENMAAALKGITGNDALSDHWADLGFAISLSTGSAYLDNLLDVYEYAQNVTALYTDGDSSLNGHQSAADHGECKALYDAAKAVSDYFTFRDTAESILTSGTAKNPIVYRGRGWQAARGGLSVFGPVLSSKSVDSHSERIIGVYQELGLLENYRGFIEKLNEKKYDVGSFTGSMNVVSSMADDQMSLAMQVKPRNTGVSVVDVTAQVAYTDLSTKKTYLLGETPTDYANRKDMDFQHTFDGTWQTLDGKFCTMSVNTFFGMLVCTIPAYVKDGTKKIPAMVTAQGIEINENNEITAVATNYMEIPENADETEVTNRTVTMGREPGQKDRMTFIPVLVADDSEMRDPARWTEVDAEVTVTAGGGFAFPIGTKELASGRNNLYEARFALTDIMGETHLSDSEQFFMITDINEYSAIPIRPQIYKAGKPAEPEIRLFFGRTELEKGKDFTVKFEGNDGVPTAGNPVTATATATGTGDPEGTRTFDFLICTEGDYDRIYMNWIADLLQTAEHVPGDEGTEISTSGLLLDMMNPMDEHIVHALLAEELQLRYDLYTPTERGFFTAERLNTARQHYRGATRDITLTNNGVTLVGGVKLLNRHNYYDLVEPLESGLKVTLGQPGEAQLEEAQVDAKHFTDALTDARRQNANAVTTQVYNPVFRVKASIYDLAWEMMVEEGQDLESMSEEALTENYESALARLRDRIGDVEYIQRPLRQTGGDEEDMRLVLKIAVPSGYYEDTVSLYQIDRNGYRKLGEEDSLRFVTENRTHFAVFQTLALNENCWYTMTAVPEPAAAWYTDADTAGGFARTALCWAVENGIINGSDGQLYPKAPATCAQTAQILKSFIENNSYSNRYP